MQVLIPMYQLDLRIQVVIKYTTLHISGKELVPRKIDLKTYILFLLL